MKQTVFVNADDSNTRQLISDTAKLITFGIENASAEYRAQNVQAVADSLQFQFYHGITLLGMVVVPKNRFFSVSNALAACVFASHWGLSIEAINRGLHRYQGVRSRFDVLYDGERHLFVKDIAHHPESIRKVMQKCREFGREQLIVIYQPHMYKELNEEASATLAALHQADMIAILDVASVKDVQEGGVDAKTFVETQQKVSNHWFYVAESHSLDVWLARLLEKPSVIVQMGMYVDRQSNAHITTNIMQVLG